MNKNIVITGAGSGQGFVHTKAISDTGASVFALDIKFSGPVRELFESRGIRAIEVDVTDENQWNDFVKYLVLNGISKVHGLVNNAGVLAREGISDISIDTWNHVINTNLTGSLLGIKSLLPLMLKSGGASIVNVGSQAGLSGHYASAYAVSKWGVRGLSKVAATEFGKYLIRSNCVLPGFIQTEMNLHTSPSFREAQLGSIPAGRAGNALDVTAAVLFLLSEKSSFINGAEITVDGGQTAHGGTYGFEKLL